MNTVLFILFICCSVAAAILTKKLTVAAAITGGALSVIIFIGVGWPGIALMGAFFLIGTLATSWKRNLKQNLGLRQEEGRRNTGQVLANGGVGALCGLLAILFPEHTQLFILLIAAAFSSATADTVSSELGTVYGKWFYDILSFKKGQRGLDGVVSLEGLLFGVAGSIVIATIYAISSVWNNDVTLIITAGTLGNLADSYLGATLERNRMIGNNAVNFLNTLTGTLTCFLLTLI